VPGGPAPGSALGKSLPLPPRTWQDQVRMVLYFILFSRSWTFSELALALCPALCGRPCSEFRSQAASYACANAGWHRRAPACLCALLGTDPPGARARPDFSRPCVRACLAQTRLSDALWTAGHSVGAKRARPCVSGARGCPSRRAGQRPGLARDSRVSVSARLQPAWRLRGRGPAGTREPGTTPGRAPDDRDGTVLWSGRRAHPADVPEPPSAAANRGEAPLPGGRRGRSAGHARPAAPPRLMRRALRPLGAPGRRRGGRGECGRQVRAGAGRAVLAVLAQPVPSARHPMALGTQRPPVLGAQCRGTRGEGAASSRPRAVFIHNFIRPDLPRLGAPEVSAWGPSARRCYPHCCPRVRTGFALDSCGVPRCSA
jgi:hypothetical protein